MHYSTLQAVRFAVEKDLMAIQHSPVRSKSISLCFEITSILHEDLVLLLSLLTIEVLDYFIIDDTSTD